MEQNTLNVTHEDALKIAQSNHQAGNLIIAERAFLDILKTIPDDFTSLHHMGIISYQKGNPQRALEYLNRAVVKNTESSETFNVRGVMHGEVGDHTAAIEDFKKAVDLNPKLSTAYSNMANSYWIMHDYANAKKASEKAIEIKPDYADAYVNLGAAISERGKNDNDAVPVWKKALEIDPLNVSAMINLGNALRNLGQLIDAEEYCIQALQHAPDHPDALLNLGNAQRDLGKLEEAEASYRRVTEVLPNYIDAYNNRALTLMDLLRYDEAITAARYALAFSPDNIDALNTLAIALRETGNLSEAEKAARRALELQPDSIDAKVGLADILFVSEQLVEAELLFNEAMAEETDSPRLYAKISAVFERTNRMDEALDALQKAIEISPEMPELYHRQALVYVMNNKLPEAITSINKALELNNKIPQLYATQSEILQSKGDMDAAREAAEKGIALKQDFPGLYFSISKVIKFTEDDDYFKKLQSMAANPDNLGYYQQTSLNFSLFKAYEDIGDTTKSFEHLKRGNDLKRKTVSYNHENQKLQFKNIQNQYTDEFIDSLKGQSIDSEKMIFIVGMPRSGTTLTEQIIASHPDVYGAGELTIFGQLDQKHLMPEISQYKEIAQQYVDKVEAICDEAKQAIRVTDKMPGNFVKIGQILTTMPHAKIIHCQRNPIDTCLSCYKQLFARGQFWSYNLEEMAEYYGRYMDLMAFWREKFPGQFLEIRYEDTVNNFENQARKLIDYVDLPWDDQCLTPHKSKRSILTASKTQVRKPVYKTSVEVWRKYEDQLSDFVSLMKPYMDAYHGE